MLKGQAKTDYQREYMREWQRKRRGSKQYRSKQALDLVRPVTPCNNVTHKPLPVSQRPVPGNDIKVSTVDADGRIIPDYY